MGVPTSPLTESLPCEKICSMTDTEPTPDPRDTLRAVIEDVENKTRKIGLYYQGSSVGTDSPETAQALQEGKSPAELYATGGSMVVIASFIIGDMAFDTTIANPVQAEFDQAARSMLPTKAELMREKIKKGLAEGKSLEDIMGEDDAEE